jgi:hypothetical protein
MSGLSHFIEVYCNSSCTALHSKTSALFCGFDANPRFPKKALMIMTLRCSRIFAGPKRRTGFSVPSGSKSLAALPVVLPKTSMPRQRNKAWIIRVTVDLPRVPLM